jgi:hypothetical protein
MLSETSQKVADKAKALYEQRYRSELEAGHRGEFVCIEPESEDYFLGATFDEAVNKAIDAHPERLTYTLRIGHAAAFRVGTPQSISRR